MAASSFQLLRIKTMELLLPLLSPVCQQFFMAVFSKYIQTTTTFSHFQLLPHWSQLFTCLQNIILSPVFPNPTLFHYSLLSHSIQSDSFSNGYIISVFSIWHLWNIFSLSLLIHFHNHMSKHGYNFIYLAQSQSELCSEDSSLSSIVEKFHQYVLKHCFFNHHFFFSWNLHYACVFLNLSPLQLFFNSQYQYLCAVFQMSYPRLLSDSQILYSNVSFYPIYWEFILSFP